MLSKLLACADWHTEQPSRMQAGASAVPGDAHGMWHSTPCPHCFVIASAAGLTAHTLQPCMRIIGLACQRYSSGEGGANASWLCQRSIPLAETVYFAVIANVSIASLNLSLLVNSVGFYQVGLHDTTSTACMLRCLQVQLLFVPPRKRLHAQACTHPKRGCWCSCSPPAV